MKTISDEKQELRENLRKRLFSLSIEERKLASLKACDFLINELKKSSFKVLSFASKPFEISLWPLNQFLIQEKRLLLPKVEGKTLETYEVTDARHLKLSSKNIQEPNPSLCLKSHEFGLILVPGLGFDDLHRIGYGQGHYDFFLKDFPHVSKWGIGFEDQKEMQIPLENHDIALDKVLFF